MFEGSRATLQIVLVKIFVNICPRCFKYQQSKLFGQFDPTICKNVTKHWAIIYPITHYKSASWANFMHQQFRLLMFDPTLFKAVSQEICSAGFCV